MRVSIPTSKRRPRSRFWATVVSALLLLLAIGGTLLITDRPGLEANYFALGEPWEGKVLATRVNEPAVESSAQVTDVLMSDVVFSVRWTGWLDVEHSGEHHFSLTVDDGGYIRIDDEILVDVGGFFGEPVDGLGVDLDAGFHRVEIGLHQRHSESYMAIRWVGPDSSEAEAQPLPLPDLYSGRPLVARKILRAAFSSWSRPYRQLLGVALLIGLVLWSSRFLLRFEKSGAFVRSCLAAFARPRPRAALLLAFFLFTFLVALSYTGTVRGGDDTSYLSAATFNTKNWFANRYGHVYLLKLFTGVSGGDPLAGVRVWWAFTFAMTLAALAVAVRSIGPGLQLRTLAVVLFVLFSQTTLMGLIGNGFADYSAAMFVTVAVALYLHGLVVGEGRPPPRHEWRALVIGVLTVAAFRSKEVGAILLVLPALFLIQDGRLDLRRFARKLAYWAAGVAALLGLLMLLDGAILGDIFFTMDSERMQRLEKMNFPQGRAPRPHDDWLKTIWPARGGVDLSLRFLWLGVCVAAIVAGMKKVRIELRLLHLMPIAYLIALIALYVRMPHPFSARMLVTMTPVACLMTGLILHYAGLDDVPWKRMLRPRVLIPGGILASAIFIFLIPVRRGELDPADFLPVAVLERFGWSAGHFATGVLLPVAVLAIVGLLALGAGRRRLRIVILALAFLIIFGTGFEITRGSLVEHHSMQVGNLLTYPWRTFEQEFDENPWKNVRLSTDLHSRYRMSAKTRASLAHVALGRQDLRVSLTQAFPAESDAAIASWFYWGRWRRRLEPALERALVSSAVWDPAGFLVLLRPKEAAEEAEFLRRQQFLPEQMSEFYQGLGDIADNPSMAEREQFMRRILGTGSIRLRRLQGDQLRAVALIGDGWTAGLRPAGLIVMNSNDDPLIQELRLSVGAPSTAYPIEVSIHDGEQLETVVFERRGMKRVGLRPVPPGVTRFVTVWSDKDWSPRGEPATRYGVKILGPDSR